MWSSRGLRVSRPDETLFPFSPTVSRIFAIQSQRFLHLLSCFTGRFFFPHECCERRAREKGNRVRSPVDGSTDAMRDARRRQSSAYLSESVQRSKVRGTNRGSKRIARQKTPLKPIEFQDATVVNTTNSSNGGVEFYRRPSVGHSSTTDRMDIFPYSRWNGRDVIG